jgi:ribosomal protein S18 acetylase RimI-like enzyme
MGELRTCRFIIVVGSAVVPPDVPSFAGPAIIWRSRNWNSDVQNDSLPLELGPPQPAERRAALELAWVYLARPDRDSQITRLLGQAETKPELLDGLLQARRGNRVVGAIWAQLQLGRSAFMSLPHVVSGEPVATGSELLESLLEVLRRHQTRLAQALLTADYGEEFDLLRAAGFEHFADLLYMASVDRAFPDQPPAGDLEFETYSEQQQDRLCRIIERTYVGSQDCPRLSGVRRMSDVVAGYRATGTFDPSRWLFLRNGGNDVGCLLLAEHAPQKQWEVAYIGLEPEARGRGWGIAAVRQAQWLARRARVEKLLLAVDAANAPAIATYAAAGFTAWDRRTVMLRIFE